MEYIGRAEIRKRKEEVGKEKNLVKYITKQSNDFIAVKKNDYTIILYLKGQNGTVTWEEKLLKAYDYLEVGMVREYDYQKDQLKVGLIYKKKEMGDHSDPLSWIEIEGVMKRI